MGPGGIQGPLVPLPYTQQVTLDQMSGHLNKEGQWELHYCSLYHFENSIQGRMYNNLKHICLSAAYSMMPPVLCANHIWQTQVSVRPIQRFLQPGEGSAVSEGASPSPISAGGAALALLWNENATHFTKDL